ncbi:MAG: sugar ABC transporter [Actinobacteria bacterium BACL4 MAG-121001-bin59]|jgi:fructose transport system substrate-binding protein|uniref:substrate-binding domain-containing protein n=1 Tax=Candidatus Nanopelagicus sp. TaxID=2518620 RepID=UPI0007148A25|nr:MAG: sugar ABC transporter [Actinobacteria bacterium BACL4 MAG-121001-bin59]KRO76946.1 MAG: sugar ABC transporter [Actinobacteria bacterium BACL4 MAG-120920-bin74]
MKSKFSRKALVALFAVSALVLSACSSGDDASGDVKVSLILKNLTNPFFVSMVKGAEAKAAELGIDLTIGSGKEEGDDAAQIAAIENAISAKHAGIVITVMSTNVNSAITKARDAGLLVIALDTPTDPADIADITFATDNREAGRLIGQWGAKKLGGQKAIIALLNIFDDRVSPVDYLRDNGFLEGMGIPVNDPNKMADEAKTGNYSGGAYEIVGNVATGANEDGGRSGMEKLLARNPNINIVYTINEPTAIGACAALKAAKKTAIVVSVDGGLPGIEAVKSGCIAATSQQYPLRMADIGLQAIYDLVQSGNKPEVTPGKDFFDTGVTLITDDPQDGVPSESTQYGIDNAW